MAVRLHTIAGLVAVEVPAKPVTLAKPMAVAAEGERFARSLVAQSGMRVVVLVHTAQKIVAVGRLTMRLVTA